MTIDKFAKVNHNVDYAEQYMAENPDGWTAYFHYPDSDRVIVWKTGVVWVFSGNDVYGLVTE